MALTPTELARYSRHLSLQNFGIEAQEKLKAARVVVVGAGGLGSPALLYLAAAGVGAIGIVDSDRVDLSNLQRQVLYEASDVTLSKAETARERLLALNPELKIVAHAVELRAANIAEILRNYNVVLDGTDRFATRYVVNDACVIFKKPLVSAAIHRFEGQAMTYVPEHGPCYRCLFPEPPDAGLVPNCAEAGVLGVLPGVMGTIQATEAIKLIAGIGELLLGRLLTYDALTMRFDEFRFQRRRDCAVCGVHPTITAPQDPVEVCSSETFEVRRLSAHEVRGLVSDSQTQLIDVREPYEFAAGHLHGAVNIPLGALPQRFDEISPQRTSVFMCRGGGRSLKACELAAVKGYRRVVNLEGGLLEWQRQIDQGLTVA